MDSPSPNGSSPMGVDVGCLLVVFFWCCLLPFSVWYVCLKYYFYFTKRAPVFIHLYHLFPVGIIFMQLTEDTQKTVDSLPYPSLPKWVKAVVVFVCMDLFLFFCYCLYNLPRKCRERRKLLRRQQRRPPPAPVVVGLSVGELEEQRAVKEQEEEYLRRKKLDGEGMSSTSSVGVAVAMVDVKA